MADNDLLQEEPTNQDLLMNAIASLRGRPDLQESPPNPRLDDRCWPIPCSGSVSSWFRPSWLSSS